MCKVWQLSYLNISFCIFLKGLSVGDLVLHLRQKVSTIIHINRCYDPSKCLHFPLDSVTPYAMMSCVKSLLFYIVRKKVFKIKAGFIFMLQVVLLVKLLLLERKVGNLVFWWLCGNANKANVRDKWSIYKSMLMLKDGCHFLGTEIFIVL